MPDNTTDLWLGYANELRRLVTTGQFDPKAQLITFAGTTLVFDAANADPEIAAQAIYDIGNIVPAWSPAFTPHSDLASTYANFLDWIQPEEDLNPNLESQISIAAANVSRAQANFDDVKKKALAAYKDELSINPKVTFADFVNRDYPTFGAARDALDGAVSSWENLQLQRYGPGYQTIVNARKRVSLNGGARDTVLASSFNMAVRSGTTAPPGSTPALPGQMPPPPASSLASSYAPAYGLSGFGTVYREWQTKSAAKKVEIGPIRLTGNSGNVNTRELGWTASMKASLVHGFLQVFGGGSASGSTMEVNISSSDFSVEFYFTGLQAFSIGPTRQWYQAGMVQTFHDRLRENAPPFFGEGGSMGLQTYQAIVGFEPKIVMTLNNNDYHSLQKQFAVTANVSIGVGPFRIGSASVSTYGDHKDVQWNNSSSSITIGPVKSTLPLLLGVLCSKL